MNGTELVLDTNILIYLSGGNKSVEEFLAGKQPVISFITEMELLSWPSLSPKDLKMVKMMIADCKVISLNDAIRDEAISIRRRTKLKLPDAIVAATAKFCGLTLVSADAHMKRVEDIDLIYLVP
jgi:predicted nucleic acid-binding protein